MRRHGACASRRRARSPTPVIDRFYFKSVYFREPSGVLFEIATIGPGFAVDEDAEHLGERLSLPPRFEPLREQLESDAHAAALPAGVAGGRTLGAAFLLAAPGRRPRPVYGGPAPARRGRLRGVERRAARLMWPWSGR